MKKHANKEAARERSECHRRAREQNKRQRDAARRQEKRGFDDCTSGNYSSGAR